jgi:chromate transporter
MSTAERALEGSPGGLGAFVRYFLYLGSLGFGGPVALAGFMHRDLVEARHWVSEEEYRLAMALAQIMPGPLAARSLPSPLGISNMA